MTSEEPAPRLREQIHELREALEQVQRRSLDQHDRAAAVQSQFRSIVEASTDGMVVVDHEGVIVFANAAAVSILGQPHDQLMGKSASFTIASEARRRLGEGAGAADMRVVSTDWEDKPAVLVLLRDVTEQQQAQSGMAHRATHDPLTGLPNRYLFGDRLDQVLARNRRRPQRLALLFCDVDNLKSVNDQHGHGVGDKVLVETARRIERVIRPGDTAAHVGGDEFVVLCEGIDAEAAEAIAERLASAFQPVMSFGDVDLHVEISVGLATTSDAHVVPGDLLDEADQAMYEAKRRNRRRKSEA